MIPAPNAPPSRPKRALLPWLVGAIVVLLLAAAVAAVAIRGGDDTGAEVGASPMQTSTTEAATPGPAEAAAPGSPSGAPMPPALKREFDALQAQAAELRHLQWKGPLDLQVVSRAELSRKVREVVARDTDPRQVAGEEATLKLMHLIPGDLDYGALVNDLLAEQVLGFYDPLTKQLVVGGEAGETELDAVTKWVIVHEMVHGLTDQVFNYGPPTDALYKADKADEAAAYSALLEGDAVMVQNLWAEKYLSDEEQFIIALGGGGGEVNTLAKTPPYVQEDLYFPYTSGVAFVEGIHDAGGFAAVDVAYRNPPTSTEQILHPETYRAGQGATPPALPNLAAATGCTSVRTGTLGQFDMQATLDSEISTEDASRAVEGWNGDAYGVVRCGNAVGMAERWETDAGTDGSRLVDGLGRWAARWSGSGRAPGADGRFSGPSGTGRVVRNGSRVDLVLAQDAATADKLVGALSGT